MLLFSHGGFNLSEHLNSPCITIPPHQLHVKRSGWSCGNVQWYLGAWVLLYHLLPHRQIKVTINITININIYVTITVYTPPTLKISHYINGFTYFKFTQGLWQPSNSPPVLASG